GEGELSAGREGPVEGRSLPGLAWGSPEDNLGRQGPSAQPSGHEAVLPVSDRVSRWTLCLLFAPCAWP
ncbi:unnamed protein product, partial [Prorocentrum cordatum]